MKQLIKLSFLLPAIFFLGGCAAGQTSNCPYQSLVGQNAFGDKVEAVRAVGMEIRLLYPDSYLGFERKPDRVNLIRDENERILAVNCG